MSRLLSAGALGRTCSSVTAYLTALIFFSLLGGCASSFEVQVEGQYAEKSDVASLYLIVDRDDPLQRGEVSEGEAVGAGGGRYLFIREWQPDPRREDLEWSEQKAQRRARDIEGITYRTGERQDVLILNVDKALLEENEALHIVLILQDAEGVYHSEVIATSVIEARPGRRIQIDARDGEIQLRPGNLR